MSKTKTKQKTDTITWQSDHVVLRLLLTAWYISVVALSKQSLEPILLADTVLMFFRFKLQPAIFPFV